MGTVREAARWAVIALTAARVTRFLTSDTLGEWLVVGPVKRWAAGREGTTDEYDETVYSIEEGTPVRYNAPRNGWRSKAVTMFDCPFCVGFWAGLGVILLSRLIAIPVIGPLIKLAGAGLALNYVVGHVSSRLD